MSSAEKAFFCSSSFDEAKNYAEHSSGSSGSGSLDADIIDVLKGGASGSTESTDAQKEQRYSLWKQSNCGSQSADHYASEFSYLAQSTIDHAVVEKWGQCMEGQQGLSCWAAPSGEAINIVVHWRANSSQPARVITSTVDNGQSEFAPDLGNSLLPANFVLDPGKLTVPVRRSRPQYVNVVVNVSHAGSNDTCNVYIPPPPKIPVPRVRFEGPVGCKTESGFECEANQFWGAARGYRLCSIEEVSRDFTAGLIVGRAVFINAGGTSNGVSLRVGAQRANSVDDRVAGPIFANATFRVWEIEDIDSVNAPRCSLGNLADKDFQIARRSTQETAHYAPGDVDWIDIFLLKGERVEFKSLTMDGYRGNPIVKPLDQDITILASLGVVKEDLTPIVVNGHVIR